MSARLWTRKFGFGSLAATLALAGCVGEPEVGGAAFSLTEGTPEAAGVIGFLNDCGTTFHLLDVTVALDRRAADNLMAHRDGPDGLFGTADDDPFDTVAEIDDVPWVGAATIQRIFEYADENGWIPEVAGAVGTYDGVPFSAVEAAATLDLANTGSQGLLDDEVGLDRRAAENIVADRPLATMEELAEVGYVGRTALERLRQYALEHGYGGGTSPADPPPQTSAGILAEEAATAGESSLLFGRTVRIRRAIVTAEPFTTAAGGVLFRISDPAAGAEEQLTVYVDPAAGQDTSFLSLFDDLELYGTFTRYDGTWELLLDDGDHHCLTLNRSGLDFDAYEDIQAAWHGTASNPEGVVRIVSSFGYTFMVPLPQVLDHPMWEGSPPGPPHDSGNEQDHAWNAAAQSTLDAWLAR